ncbi:10253_t:CDS:2 [Diversispora eburnea]|uniref:10253_t:CDS:1 n=1 Tax=Diversispora eburnea TaxID=1213867 RepID=A0A9N8WFF2_9GLOM|nr:10253_t:CDS:2 [Diversispora eburnea]
MQITIPFPPPLHDKDLIPKLKKGKMPLRTTNQFLLYRTALINTLHSIGYEEYNMRNISKMASELWKLEPNYVQEEYKKLANKVKRIYQDMEIKNIDTNKIENCHENNNRNDVNENENKTEF